jgi:hypothetical protein
MISSEGSGAEQAPDPRAVDNHDRVRRADDDTIRALVIRLSRAHPSGGKVIERAAILASGGDLEAVVSWIVAHAGQPETTASAKSDRGLHAARLADAHPPRRYVLPAGALD